jgi:acetyltransferase EpsM
MSKKVVILGGLGNATMIAADIQDARRRGLGEWEVAGFLNDRMQVGEDLEGFPILGALKDVKRFLDDGYFFINTIYRIDGQDLRLALFESLGIPDERLATFVHPMAYVAGNSTLGPGTVVLPYASVATGTRIGRCCLIFDHVFIGHDDVIGDYCHIAPHACVGSYLKIGRGVHIGLNATIHENLTLGDCCALGMSAALLNDAKDGEIWAGVPAKFLRMAKKEL